MALFAAEELSSVKDSLPEAVEGTGIGDSRCRLAPRKNMNITLKGIPEIRFLFLFFFLMVKPQPEWMEISLIILYKT